MLIGICIIVGLLLLVAAIRFGFIWFLFEIIGELFSDDDDSSSGGGFGGGDSGGGGADGDF